MEVVRNHILKSNMKKFVVLLGDYLPEEKKNLDSFTQILSGLNLDLDIDQFVKKNRTGLKEIRQHYEYESYQTVKREYEPFSFFGLKVFCF